MLVTSSMCWIASLQRSPVRRGTLRVVSTLLTSERLASQMQVARIELAAVRQTRPISDGERPALEVGKIGVSKVGQSAVYGS